MMHVMPRRRVAREDASTEFLREGRAWLTADDLARMVPAVPVADLGALARAVSDAVDEAVELARNELRPFGTPSKAHVEWLKRIAAQADRLLAVIAASPELGPEYAGQGAVSRAWLAGERLVHWLDPALLRAMGRDPGENWGRHVYKLRDVCQAAAVQHASRLRRGAPRRSAARGLALTLHKLFVQQWPRRAKPAEDFVVRAGEMIRVRLREQLPDGAEVARVLTLPEEAARGVKRNPGGKKVPPRALFPTEKGRPRRGDRSYK